MSIGYYVRDVARYNDYKKLSDYWDSSFKDDVCKLMTDYCSDNKIDEAFREEILEEIDERFTCFPISEDYYEEKIGYVSAGKFYFSFNYYGRFRIGSVQELKEFLKTRSGFVLVDEYGEIADIDELVAKK